jgi:hypothetical protein
MRQCRWFAALLVLAGLTITASGQNKATKLTWKFEKDKSFYQELTTKTDQTMKIAGQTINQTQSQTFYFKWTPKDYDTKTKSWEIEQTIIGVKMDIEIGGNKIQYDSTKEGTQSNPLGEFFKQLVDSTFTLTVNPEMKVTKVAGRDKFVEKLVKANQQMEPLLKEIITDESLKQMADPAFAALPKSAVKEKDTWKKPSELNMGPIGKYKTEYTYTYEGKDSKANNLDRINVVTKMEYIAPDPSKGQPQLPFKITKANLNSTKASGYILFNPKAGRVVNSEMEVNLEGTLSIEIGGMETKVDLNQKQTVTVKTTDKNPISKKPSKGGAEK